MRFAACKVNYMERSDLLQYDVSELVAACGKGTNRSNKRLISGG